MAPHWITQTIKSANKVVQKLPFPNNNRLKQPNAEHFVWACEITNRVISQARYSRLQFSREYRKNILYPHAKSFCGYYNHSREPS
jgi:hypothetical protein